MVAQESTKRRSKDSIFTMLFSDKKNLLQLYRELCPEDTDVAPEEIRITTLRSVMVNRMVNDLGFIVRNKLLYLTEAQSEWDNNITLRMLLYLSQSLKDYIDSSGLYIHSGKRLDIPKPELYVIYSGSSHVPEEISFAREYFGGDCELDLKVHVITGANADTIAGQYIGFCNVYDEMRQRYGDSLDCAKILWKKGLTGTLILIVSLSHIDKFKGFNVYGSYT